MTLETGTTAPEFTLMNQDGQSVSLADHLGKNVIVYFYPAASTPGCTVQACDFRDNINSLKALGYVVIGISPDKQSKLKTFQEKQNLNFDLLSDEESSVQKAYDAYGAKQMYGKEYMARFDPLLWLTRPARLATLSTRSKQPATLHS